MDCKNDEISAGKDRSAPSSGYFSTVFPPNSPSEVSSKDFMHSDLYRSLSKDKSEGLIVNADRKSQGDSPIRGQVLYKDGKPMCPVETIDSSYFGSSLHYGGRDFVASSPSKKVSDTPKNYKSDEGDDLSNSNMATRGDWWQGSLYY